MEMHQIRYFLAAAKTLNFTQAAEECHVAQPSLSRAIRNLEEELGGDLFRRERSLSHLTDLGQLMLPRLRQAYESALAAKTLAASYKKGGSAPLRLALSQTINLVLLTPALTELMKVFPGLELKTFRGTATEVVENLKNGNSEIAVAGPLGADWERIDSWPLFEESHELVVNPAHALARHNSVSFSDLKSQRLLCRSYCEQASELAALLQQQNIEQMADNQIQSDQDLMALLEANLGVSIMTRSALGPTNLCSLAVDGLDLKRTVSLYAVAGRERSPAGAGLVKLLRAANWTERRNSPPRSA